MTGSGKVAFTSLLGNSRGGFVFTNFLVTQFGQGHALFVRPHIVYTVGIPGVVKSLLRPSPGEWQLLVAAY